jgi:hypothetical protein
MLSSARAPKKKKYDDDADGDADRDDAQALDHDHFAHMAGLGAERNADTELAGTLGDRRGENAVEPDHPVKIAALAPMASPSVPTAVSVNAGAFRRAWQCLCNPWPRTWVGSRV